MNNLNTDMQIIELCLDEQAHVAGGSLPAIKLETSVYDLAKSGTSSGTSTGNTKADGVPQGWDIALSGT